MSRWRAGALAVVLIAGTAAAQPAAPNEPRDATRGGVNGPALPAQRGRESPLPIDSKKQRVALAKSTAHGPPPAPGTRPVKLVNLYRYWTKEWLAVDPGALPDRAAIDRFLRDHYTNQPTQMEPRLFTTVLAAAAHFKRDVVEIVSAFRHPKYNLILRKKGRQVARDSQHSVGTAVDFTVPGVATAQLRAWAIAQRLGGVGVYTDSGFVHIDTGPIRTWSGE